MSNKIIHIIGTGPAALMAGTQLALKGYEIHFYDQKVKEIIFLNDYNNNPIVQDLANDASIIIKKLMQKDN